VIRQYRQHTRTSVAFREAEIIETALALNEQTADRAGQVVDNTSTLMAFRPLKSSLPTADALLNLELPVTHSSTQIDLEVLATEVSDVAGSRVVVLDGRR
jgi:hypothetical protein